MTAQTVDTRPGRRTRAGEIRRPSLTLLTRVELRKIVDTRSGQALLALTLLLSFGVLGYLVAQGAADGLSYSGWARDASYPVIALLPVLGVLAMASEWTQRTVLTTFTQTPRRIRVLTAKLLAAMARRAGGHRRRRRWRPPPRSSSAAMILDAHVSWREPRVGARRLRGRGGARARDGCGDRCAHHADRRRDRRLLRGAERRAARRSPPRRPTTAAGSTSTRPSAGCRGSTCRATSARR